jgi:hypothetical protein
VRARLAADPAALAGLVADALPAPAGDGDAEVVPRLVLVVDQFEELFDPEVAQADRQAFVAALAAAAPDGAEASGALVVVGMRADFFGRAAEHPALQPALSSPVVVGPMTGEQARHVIDGPAREAGLDLEDSLAELLLTDLGLDQAAQAGGLVGAGALPLLSHALLATWQRREGRWLTIAGYLASGRVEHALAATAEAAYHGLAEPDRPAARTLLLALVRLGADGAQDTRRPRSRAELVDHSPDPARAARALEAFAAPTARLLTLDEGRVEITHEALLRAWPALRSWIEADRAGMLIAQRLADDAHAWQHSHRDPDLLYRGNRLALAREWATTPTAAVAHDAASRDFLAASIDADTKRAEAERSRARRTRLAAITLGALLVLSLAAGAAAVSQWRQAVAQEREATAQERVATAQRLAASARELVTRAETQRDTDPRATLRLALAADRLDPHAGARARLFTTLTTTPIKATLTGHTDTVRAVALAADGRTALTGSGDGTAIVWDLTNPTRPARRAALTGHTGAVSAVALAADGRTALTGSTDRTAIVWDRSPEIEFAAHVIDHTCAAAGRGLSQDEWAEAIPGVPYEETCP